MQSTVNYGYGNSNWKDQLTSYNGTAVTYDASGNPLNWRNASSMNWTGRLLDSMTLSDGTNLSFKYNSDGFRVFKTVGNETVRYRLDKDTLLSEEHESYTIAFLYVNDSLVGFNYNGDNYYYGIDNLGVIRYVYNESGAVVVTYSYDAWGNTISVTGDATLISANPIRYKSYYYDRETGFFYLNSRYYDPVVCRFISPDGLMGVNDDIATYNLYVYCGNNPVNRSDEYGFLWKELWGGIQKATKKIAPVVKKVAKKVAPVVKKVANKIEPVVKKIAPIAEKVVEPVLHAGNSLAVVVGIDTAAIGALFLDMKKDKATGVYHANFECWQQYFGYDDLYDIVFEIGTDMNYKKFLFSYGGRQLVLWAWKGDYINLGAGAELGIYYKDGDSWSVDKNLAMPMKMTVKYKGKNIINYQTKTWWITGFNPKYLNAREKDIVVTYTICFPNVNMFNAFKNASIRQRYGWSFNLSNYSSTYTFK